MNWQHLSDDGRYNFLLAWKDQSLVGVLGYIPISQYDPALDRNVVFLAIWKTRDDLGTAGTGIALLKSLEKLYADSVIAVVGIHESAIPIYRALGYRVGELNHFFIANPNTKQTIATIPHTISKLEPYTGDAVFEPLSKSNIVQRCSELDVAGREDMLPNKSGIYFLNRYLDHPIYTYTVCGVYLNSALCGLIAIRAAKVANAIALRIVDYYGSEVTFSECGAAIKKMLLESGAEYVDLLNIGLPLDVIEGAGFSAVDREGPVIVPNHFEPFDGSKNIPITYAVQNNHPLMLFRADGDQDRPNIV